MDSTPVSLVELLDQVAAPTPAPGGGACCGWAAALAAGLIEMAATVAEARATGAEHSGGLARIRARALDLRGQATRLADQDRASYAPVLAAERSGDAAALERALTRATDTPFALAQVAAELTVLAREVLAVGRPSLRGDTLTALELARAACRAAAGLVEINLEALPEDPRRQQVRALVARAEDAADDRDNRIDTSQP